MRQFVRKNPVLFSVIYLLGIVVLKKQVMVPIVRSSVPYIVENVAELMVLSVEIAITWIVIRKLDLSSCIPFCTEGLWKGILFSIPGFLLVLFLLYENISGCFWKDIPLLVIYTLKNFSIGMMEELIMRGLFLGLFLICWKDHRNGQYKAVFFSSMIFAVAHLGNLLTNDVNQVLAQVIYAFFFGVFFAAIAIRCKNIWPGIIVHSLIDFASGISGLIPVSDVTDTVTTTGQEVFSFIKIVTNIGILMTFPLFIYAIVLLICRKKEI